jgi:hypothetical protein
MEGGTRDTHRGSIAEPLIGFQEDGYFNETIYIGLDPKESRVQSVQQACGGEHGRDE